MMQFWHPLSFAIFGHVGGYKRRKPVAAVTERILHWEKCILENCILILQNAAFCLESIDGSSSTITLRKSKHRQQTIASARAAKPARCI